MLTESVWNYPRPPVVEPTSKRIHIYFRGVLIADTTRAYRVLETSHPPVYYIPLTDVRSEFLARTSRQTFCEFKGVATYWTLNVNGEQVADCAWSYEDPTPGFEAIKSHLPFYADKMDDCFVDDERVDPQPGIFYGGWITSEITGPFKTRM